MNRYRIVLLGVCLLIGLLLGIQVMADTLADFDLHWHVIASGGEPVSSASYEMHHTIGQPVRGAAQGNGFLVGSGYWPGVVRAVPSLPGTSVYLPVILSQ